MAMLVSGDVLQMKKPQKIPSQEFSQKTHWEWIHLLVFFSGFFTICLQNAKMNHEKKKQEDPEIPN